MMKEQGKEKWAGDSKKTRIWLVGTGPRGRNSLLPQLPDFTRALPQTR
jgi:hypothetical protein